MNMKTDLSLVTRIRTMFLVLELKTRPVSRFVAFATGCAIYGAVGVGCGWLSVHTVATIQCLHEEARQNYSH